MWIGLFCFYLWLVYCIQNLYTHRESVSGSENVSSFVSVYSINNWPYTIFQGVSFRFIIFDFILSFYFVYSFISLQPNTNTSSHFDGLFWLKHWHWIKWWIKIKYKTNKQTAKNFYIYTLNKCIYIVNSFMSSEYLFDILAPGN